MGSVQHPNLNKITRQIWSWCEKKNLWLTACYVQSKENKADKASRILPSETEWELADYAFKEIVITFGEPKSALFATNKNAKCNIFISWFQDSRAINCDAFSVDWEKYFFYAFPPFSMILRTLNKIVTVNAEGIVVVPLWQSQPWFPLFKKLLINEPLIFTPNDNLLCSTFYSIHPLAKSLTLAAGKLSARYYGNETFPKILFQQC